MKITDIYSSEEITNLAKADFRKKRALKHLEGWFLAREIAMSVMKYIKMNQTVFMQNSGRDYEESSTHAGEIITCLQGLRMMHLPVPMH